jgi:hypothetical protein
MAEPPDGSAFAEKLPRPVLPGDWEITMRLALATSIALLPVLGCMQITTDTGSGTTAGGTSSGAGGGDDGGGSGTNCTLDPASQVQLCAQIAACPGISVDPAAFPGCGFRVGGAAAIDPECLCSGSLCPIGVPTTCAQAAQLLQGQNLLEVCQQVSEGRCVQVDEADAATVAPGCDRMCQAQCGAAADCLQICGC